jgi:hypothetical protein
MGRSTRRAVLQGTAALAGLAAVQASGLAGSALGLGGRGGPARSHPLGGGNEYR